MSKQRVEIIIGETANVVEKKINEFLDTFKNSEREIYDKKVSTALNDEGTHVITVLIFYTYI